MSRVLITGGAGFLGYHVVDELIKSGYEITVQDIIPKEAATKLKDVIKDIDYTWKSLIDISEDDLKGVDHVVHLAAQGDVPLSLTSPKWTWMQNTDAVISLMDVLRRKPCKSIFMSTDVIYGRVPADKIPITESQSINPTNLYAASKAAMELLITTYANQWNLPFLVFRLAGMYGEHGRQKHGRSDFYQAGIGRGEHNCSRATARQTRDFNYVKNTAFAIAKAIESKETQGIWNISNGKETSIRKLAETIIKLTDSDSKIIETPWRPGEIGVRLCLSIEKARKELGYEPKYTMEEGLDRTIKWLKQ